MTARARGTPALRGEVWATAGGPRFGQAVVRRCVAEKGFGERDI